MRASLSTANLSTVAGWPASRVTDLPSSSRNVDDPDIADSRLLAWRARTVSAPVVEPTHVVGHTRRRAIEQFHHPPGEPLLGDPGPESSWPAAVERFTVLQPYGTTCYFAYYHESFAWAYHKQYSFTSAGECASACLHVSGCTGFELPVNGDYCAFWFNGNCDHPGSLGITSAGTSRGAVVVTYVLCSSPLVNCSWLPPPLPPNPPTPPQSPLPPRPPPASPSPPARPPSPPQRPSPPSPPWLVPPPSPWETLTRVGIGICAAISSSAFVLYVVGRPCSAPAPWRRSAPAQPLTLSVPLRTVAPLSRERRP